MFHSMTLNNKINRLQGKVSRLIYRNNISFSFEDILKKDETVNLQILTTEMYMPKNYLAPEIMEDIFHFVQKPYNLGNNSALKRRRNPLVYFDTETISCFATKIWELVSNAIKKAT